MLKENEIQALYEEVQPDADLFSYVGEQLNAILPALQRMDIFKDVEFEVLTSPQIFTPVIMESGVSFSDERVVTVQLTGAFRPANKVKIYSMTFMPGVFRDNIQHLQHGTYMLPANMSAHDFKLTRSILTKVELERIHNAKYYSEPVIEPDGQIISELDENLYYVNELKAKLIQDFTDKLEKIFAMNIVDFGDDSISDVQRFGSVFLRLSNDSYTIDSLEGSIETYNYFHVIEPVGDLPF